MRDSRDPAACEVTAAAAGRAISEGWGQLQHMVRKHDSCAGRLDFTQQPHLQQSHRRISVHQQADSCPPRHKGPERRRVQGLGRGQSRGEGQARGLGRGIWAGR